VLIVSRRIREQFENGRDYYTLSNRRLTQPSDALAWPSIGNLVYHYELFAALERL